MRWQHDGSGNFTGECNSASVSNSGYDTWCEWKQSGEIVGFSGIQNLAIGGHQVHIFDECGQAGRCPSNSGAAAGFWVSLAAGGACSVGVALSPVSGGTSLGLSAVGCGAFAAGAGTIAANSVEGNSWNQNLIRSAVIGGIAGGVFAAAGSTVSRITSRQAFLYRGDGRPPSTLFNGMSARDPSMEIGEHLSGGSGLIATSRSKFVADGFAIQNRGFTYQIRDPGTGQRVRYGVRFSHLRGERETVFTSIDGADILGAIDLEGNWIPNPNYVSR